MNGTDAAPVGLSCPGCGKPPALFLFGDSHQAFCGTDDCPWLTWDPALSIEALLADVKVIDLPQHDE